MTGRIDHFEPTEPLILPSKQSESKETNPQDIDQFHAYQAQFKTTDQIHKVDEKRFALMLGDAFIENTKYEGGEPSVTYEYWKTLLKEMKDGKSHISNPLPKEQIHTVLTDLDNCLTADRLLNRLGHTLTKPTDKLSMENMSNEAARTADMKELLGIINQHLNSGSHRFVLPLQHAGMAGSSGHVFCAILEKNEKNQIICTILDKGEGSGMHRIVTISNKRKRSYHFDPIRLHDPDMFKPESEAGLVLLQLLQKYRFPDERISHKFASEEIYNLFLQAGTLLEPTVPIGKEMGVTSNEVVPAANRSSDCSYGMEYTN